MVADYAEGKRISYTNPLQYFFVCSAIAIAFGYSIEPGFISGGWEPSSLTEEIVVDVLRLIETYPAGYILLLTPLSATFTKFIFLRNDRNFTETLVLTVYLYSQAAILITAIFVMTNAITPLISLSSQSLISFITLVLLIGPIPLYIGWAFATFFGVGLVKGYLCGLVAFWGFIILEILLLASLTSLLTS